MKINKIPIELKKGQVVTSLYQSPFDYSLLYLILFGKTGVNLKIILDDIDNLGVDRQDYNHIFMYKEKYLLSKTRRTNIRPLTCILPKHLLLNLSNSNFKDLDNAISITKIKDILGYKDTVDHWIKDTTNEMGTYSLIGPNKSFAFVKVDNHFIFAIKAVKKHLKRLIDNFSNKENSYEFIEWLFTDDILIEGEYISDYYIKFLGRIIDRFDLSENVSISKISDIRNQENTKKILDLYKSDISLQQDYKKALVISKGEIGEDFPFYAISKIDGSRLLSIEHYLHDYNNYIIAPKVLMLNNFQNLILPDHASHSKNVTARDIMYKNPNINCNQIFCDEDWIKYLSKFDLKIKLDDLEKNFYNKEYIDFKELVNTSFEDDPLFKYKNWIIESTLDSIKKTSYPLLFLILLQDKIFYKNIPRVYKIDINI